MITPRNVVVALALAATMVASAIWLPIGLYLLPPIAVAIGIVLLRNPGPARAGTLGALWTAGIYAGVGIIGTFVLFLMGELAKDDPDCDAFCWNNEGGLLVNTLLFAIFAVPMGILGGIVSALVAIATRSGQPHTQTR